MVCPSALLFDISSWIDSVSIDAVLSHRLFRSIFVNDNLSRFWESLIKSLLRSEIFVLLNKVSLNSQRTIKNEKSIY